ncbi:hypothetical protein [Rhizobium sp. CNPSo 4039]|uniref:hypothetical protein n=1 Tax=Rhizobium sp. CNPSo 4039 TaxID=3021409 RepID=UPI00254D4656|nr:hypothetical protein [Rhizobium sp. CNPSo 4039]MDK4714371.1 hypothetical protein [Rhizobium sp. CNPSo 4039]
MSAKGVSSGGHRIGQANEIWRQEDDASPPQRSPSSGNTPEIWQTRSIMPFHIRNAPGVKAAKHELQPDRVYDTIDMSLT